MTGTPGQMQIHSDSDGANTNFLKAHLSLPTIVSYSSDETPILKVILESSFHEPVTIRTSLSPLVSLDDLTEITEKESGRHPVRGSKAQGQFKGWKFAFSPKNVDKYLTLYPEQPHELSYKFRHSHSIPFDQKTFDSLVVSPKPDHFGRDNYFKQVPGGMSQLVIGETYFIRIRPSLQVQWIRGTKDELLQRYDETLRIRGDQKTDQPVIGYEKTKLPLVGDNQLDFLVAA